MLILFEEGKPPVEYGSMPHPRGFSVDTYVYVLDTKTWWRRVFIGKWDHMMGWEYPTIPNIYKAYLLLIE
jgi:hypothetical protein